MLVIINSAIWALVTILIMVFGVYFSKKLSFPQFKIFKIFKSLSGNEKISPLKTLFLTLGGRIGVGSIAGVAFAIYIGGAGTVFWMWVMAIFSSSLAYCETLLGIKYKVSSFSENFGGPSYYIRDGLNKKKIAFLYSFIVIIAYIIGFIPIQANTIVKVNIFFNKYIIGFILFFIVFFIIKKGISRIITVTNILVPFMTFIYIFLSLVVIFNNIDKVVDVFLLIIKGAFNFKSFFGGFIATMLIGIQRGIFSNEAGIGLGAIAASYSDSTDGCKCGYIQILGVYITTMLICTSTAFMILLFDYQSIYLNNLNGIELTALAFNYHFGFLGFALLFIFILLFSLTTILTGYYYCESSFRFLRYKSNIFKVIVPISVFFGCIVSSALVWLMIDLLVGILSIINIYSIYKLKDEAFEYHQKCDRI